MTCQLDGTYLLQRDAAAELYLAPKGDAGAHRAAFRCLLLFTREASRQIRELTQTA